MLQIDNSLDRIRYGCVFCRAARESAVARALEEQCSDLQATIASQIKHKSENGQKRTEEKILLPGYVFFRTTKDHLAIPQFGRDMVRVLRNTEGSWQLQGADEKFAEFVFTQGGVIGLSQAREIGSRVVIASGPLKSMEGNIIKIDRHRRNGQVEIHFDDRVWRVWLAFEVVE